MKIFEEMIVSNEDADIVRTVANASLSVTMKAGTAIVVADVLKQATVVIAKDAVKAVLEGNVTDAEMLGLMGLEITNFLHNLEKAIGEVDESDQLIAIAKRSRDAATAKDNKPKKSRSNKDTLQ